MGKLFWFSEYLEAFNMPRKQETVDVTKLYADTLNKTEDFNLVFIWKKSSGLDLRLNINLWEFDFVCPK